jgi:hypothetical protein
MADCEKEKKKRNITKQWPTRNPITDSGLGTPFHRLKLISNGPLVESVQKKRQLNLTPVWIHRGWIWRRIPHPNGLMQKQRNKIDRNTRDNVIKSKNLPESVSSCRPDGTSQRWSWPSLVPVANFNPALEIIRRKLLFKSLLSKRPQIEKSKVLHELIRMEIQRDDRRVVF